MAIYGVSNRALRWLLLCTYSYTSNNLCLVGFAPTDKFNHVFACVDSSGGDCSPFMNDFSLLDALESRGEKFSRLASHAVAALLNSMNDDVAYDLTSEEVIEKTITAIASADYETLKDELDYLNNQECPLMNGKEKDDTA